VDALLGGERQRDSNRVGWETEAECVAGDGLNQTQHFLGSHEQAGRENLTWGLG
jgi:hypothetical protein